jgi:hypothetical protein
MEARLTHASASPIIAKDHARLSHFRTSLAPTRPNIRQLSSDYFGMALALHRRI